MTHLRDRCLLCISLATLFLLFLVSPASAGYRDLPPRLAALLDAADERKMLSGGGAVILEKNIEMVTRENGACLLTKRYAGIVLDQKSASDYGQITSSFNAHFEDIKLDYARTYGKDRDALSISKDAVQIKTLPGLGGAKTYSDLRILTFSLSGLTPGTIFEYQVSLNIKPVIKGGWSHQFHFQFIQTSQVQQHLPRIDPVLKSNVLLVMPETAPFKFHASKSVATPKITSQPSIVTYAWERENIAPIALEANMPALDLILPSIWVSSLDRWEKVDHWANDQFRPNYLETPEIEKLVKKLTENKESPREKIKAVYGYVQSKIEYVMADFGRSGFKPHPAGQVLENGYGDCKDQTALTISMLRVLGIEAYPALLIPFPHRNINMEIPTHAFNHAIAYVPLPGGDIWIDATSNSRFPNLSWPNQKRSAFIVDGKGGYFKKTPAMNLDGNQGTMKNAFSFSRGGLFLDIEITAANALAESIKGVFSRLLPAHQKESIRRWVKSLFPKAGVISIDLSDMKATDVDLKIDVKLEFDDAMEKEAEYFPMTFSIVPTLNFFAQYYTLVRPEERKHEFNTGFPFDINAEWRISPPDDSFVIDFLPEEERIDSSFFAYSMGCTKANGAVKVLTKMSHRTANISKEQYSDFYDDYHRMIAKATGRVVFKKQKVDKETVALESEIKGNPDDIENQLKLSKRYLRTGKFEQAHRLLENALQQDQGNAELHYYLGISLGYLNQYDAASAALNKARDLGYIP